MRIVHLNTVDNHGGAAKTAVRIIESLIEYEVKLIVLKKSLKKQWIIGIDEKRFQKIFFINFLKIIEKLKISKHRKRKLIFSSGTLGIRVAQRKEILEAEIIHLHWINGTFISINEIEMLLKSGKQVVWTLHDSWAFTGGCHIREGCDKYKNKCGKCKILFSNDENDISRKLLQEKIVKFNYENLTIVTPSKWLGNCAQKSSIFKNKKVRVIPNPINTKKFKKFNKLECREKMGINSNKILLAFGAINSVKTKYKGYEYLVKLIENIEGKYGDLNDQVELVVFGVAGEIKMNTSIKINAFGELNEEEMILIYNSCDVFINPSIEDNFPNTTLESLACGVPNVAFETGGLIDMIEHKKNGYIAKYKSVEDLMDGVKWCIDNLDKGFLQINARKKIEENYSYKQISKEYSELYKKIIKK